MIYLRRIFMVSAALVAINMQGCGCDDNDDKYYPPPQTNYQVEGTTSKGLLRGFTVSAYSISDTGTVGSQPIATSTTDDGGSYTLNVPRNQGEQPLLIRVTPAASGSVMVCDMSFGCGDVAFGGLVPMAADSEFTLSALIPSAEDVGTANITIFTDIAAEYTLNALPTSGADAIRAAIAAANSRVANRFGIVGEITQLPVIDLTNNTAVLTAMNNGNSAYVRYAAVNASIIAAVLSDNPTTSIAAGLRMFVDNYVETGLAGNTSAEADTGFGEILTFSQSLLDIVRLNIGAENTANLSALIVALAAEAQMANNETPNSYDQGTPSSSAGATPLAKVKAMVEDIRNLAISLGDTAISGGTIGSISDDFAVQVRAAELATSQNAAYLFEAMALAASAVDDANRVYSANNSATSYTSDNGITVTIAEEDDFPIFTVDQTVDVMGDTSVTPVDVTLTAHNSATITDNLESEAATATINGGYAVSGSAASTDLSMTIKDGSSIDVTNMATVEWVNSQDPQMTETETLDAFELDLLVGITQLAVNDPLTLSGNLSVSLADVSLEDTTSVTQASTTETTEILVGMVSLNFSGDISNTTGEGASFSVSVSGDGTGVSFVETWTDGTSSTTGETDTTYADLYGSIAFTAKLTGIPSLVTMNYDVARTGIEAVDNNLTIKYPGKLFRFTMALEDGEPDGNLTIVNQDGVVINLSETIVGGESRVSGTITLNGTQYATIEEDTTVVVRYSDDSLESL